MTVVSGLALAYLACQSSLSLSLGVGWRTWRVKREIVNGLEHADETLKELLAAVEAGHGGEEERRHFLVAILLVQGEDEGALHYLLSYPLTLQLRQVLDSCRCRRADEVLVEQRPHLGLHDGKRKR